MLSHAKAKQRLASDAWGIAASAAAAWFLVSSGLLADALSTGGGSTPWQSFVVGFFFTSLFTLAPATAALAELSQHASLFSVAFFGALGSVAGDLVLFNVFRERLLADFRLLLRETHTAQPTLAVLHSRFFRFLTPLFGAFLLASPLPDEPALALMGLSRTRTGPLIAVSFTLHFFGILVLAGTIGFLSAA